MVKFSVLGKITLTSIVLQAIILTVLEAFVIYFHVNFVSQFQLTTIGDGISQADLIYHSIFILSLFFQILLTVDALWHRNSVQIIALVIFNFLSLAYAGIQLYQHQILEDRGTENATYAPNNPIFSVYDRNAPKIYYQDRMRPVEHTIIGLISGFSVYLAIMSYLLSKEFGWENYKTYSADIRVRDAYWNLTILQTLIKMDIFFICTYAIQLIPSQQIGYYSSLIEIVLVFFCGTFMLLMAWFAVKMELKYLLLSVINIYSISLIYWAFRLITINVHFSNTTTDPYEYTRRFLSFFLSVILVLVAFTVYFSVICFRNMMRGIYVLTVFGQNEDDQGGSSYLGASSYLGTNNSESPSTKHESKRQSAIRQQQLLAKERENDK
ncbi:10791_t:CDS:2, partial [Cetraspora pellucida]